MTVDILFTPLSKPRVQ